MPTVTDIKSSILNRLNENDKAAPLAVFRVLFGFIMVISMLRFWIKGWIDSIYIQPQLNFHYEGFESIPRLGEYTYLLVMIITISAFLVMIGYQYRLSILVFFFSFTYLELLEKTTYLNHYYFISVISFMLIWLPANCRCSIDSDRDPSFRSHTIPKWNIDILKVMIAIVYLYAGFAKLNSDWLLRAMPLTIWLPSKASIPIIGPLLQEKWMHFVFSWSGAFYDLSIVFFLLFKKTRVWAFIAVVLFHVLTGILFPIGMFPYIMIAATTIFFSPDFHEKAIDLFRSFVGRERSLQTESISLDKSIFTKLSPYILVPFIVIQLLFPMRSLAMTENVYWTEEGYRFSWRVMLMEKTGYANFKVVDAKTGKRFYIQNQDFLTPLQEKQMSTQPDFILEYGQFLKRHFADQGHQNIQVFVESYVALNGRPNQVFISPEIDLTKVNYTQLVNNYITPLHE